MGSQKPRKSTNPHICASTGALPNLLHVHKIQINRAISAQMRRYPHLCDNECLKIMQIHIHPHLRKWGGTHTCVTMSVSKSCKFTYTHICASTGALPNLLHVHTIQINRAISVQMRGYLHLCNNECLKITQIHIHPHLHKCRDTSKFIPCT